MKELKNQITQIHNKCHALVFNSLGKHLPVAGNIGVFCQSEEDYKNFLEIKNSITKPSDNPNQKYFELKEPIIIEATDSIPSATYTHLYIRKYDPTPYGKYLGDVDFILPIEEYIDIKTEVENGNVNSAQMYDRPQWDTIQITEADINAVAYISTKEFSEKVRVKFD